ncbi:class I SAM-dependent methyltransferase [Inmirania thermothiophila]|uniref:Methyltransferase family protein n=1 Tax=Inmirania thermothiophila TaxID=1750597 RepID=A0A3N1XSJ8_9GAMM|nr:class I SAM-dependent methyltransferase [Inmirania thermothiophila]ROR29630.1 methyltransferase family protein [Inmirania thermothiophila]
MKTSISDRMRRSIVRRFFTYPGGDYQDGRDPEGRFRLICDHVDLSQIGSVLDIGCNAGRITRLFAEAGKFAVGLDVAPYYLTTLMDMRYAPKTPAFGKFPLTRESVDLLPSFDLVLLLSVHHWWVKEHGDAYAQAIVAKLAGKARRHLVIEFAASNDKYGYREPRFDDDEERSVTDYALDWLKGVPGLTNVRKIGRKQERNAVETFRYLFLCDTHDRGQDVRWAIPPEQEAQGGAS